MAKCQQSTYICVIILSVFAHGSLAQNGPLVNTRKVADYFQDIKDNVLGVSFVQGLFDDAAFSSRYILHDNDTVQQIIAEMAGNLSKRFTERIKLVIDTRDALVEAFKSVSEQVASSNECCDVKQRSFKYEPMFLQNVDWNNMCTRVSEYTSHQYTNPINEAVVNVLKLNTYRVNGLKWQYFGSEEGVLFQFPSHHVSSCTSFDPRFRPWYAATVSPTIKDVVMVIDTSGSMRGAAIEIVKQAALTVLETLNPNDRVNIVQFSNTTSTPPEYITLSSCMNSELAYALPENIKYLRRFIYRFQANGGTFYVPALDAAFDFFIKSSQPLDKSERTRVILFLTDGKPEETENAILAHLAEKNKKLNNSVTIMTYGIATSLAPDSVKLLENMARQLQSDDSYGEVRAGLYTPVTSINNLRYNMGSYYSYFGDSYQDTPVISYPYIDASGLGLITSICLPVHYPARVLKGVTCVDVRMVDVLGDILYVPGQYSYAFLIDGIGKVFFHPLLPGPLNKESRFLDVAELERESEATEVIESMKKGESGHKSFITTITSARGNVTKQGVNVQRMLATYFWKKVDNTNFSLCLIFTEKDNEILLTEHGTVQNFLSNRFNVEMPQNACQLLSKVATVEMSSVKYTRAAYRDVSSYLNTNVAMLKNFLTGDSNTESSKLKNGVKEMTVLTEKIEAFWKSSRVSYVSSRYIGTQNGVFRSYPGISLSHSFDHMNRPWYEEARSNKGSLVVAIPYEDALETGRIVLSLVHTINEGKSSSSSSDHVVTGVIGADVTLDYLYYTLEDLVPECKKVYYTCFLVDTSGFLIYHSDFLKRSAQRIPNTHITELEPDIAHYLIDGENGSQDMVRQFCINYGRKYVHYTWTLALQNTNISKRKRQFHLEKVNGTNLIFGIKANQGAESTCRCNIEKCGNDSFRACECPCYLEGKYDGCNNRFQESEYMPICAADKPFTNTTGPIRNEEQISASLAKCYPVQCAALESRRDCAFEASCRWCRYLCSDDICQQPYDNDKGNDSWMVILIMVMPISPGFIAFCVHLVRIKCKENCNKRPPLRSSTNEVTQGSVELEMTTRHRHPSVLTDRQTYHREGSPPPPDDAAEEEGPPSYHDVVNLPSYHSVVNSASTPDHEQLQNVDATQNVNVKTASDKRINGISKSAFCSSDFLRVEVESMRAHRRMNRLKISESSQLMIAFIKENEDTDYFMNPDFPKYMKQNPWKRKKIFS